MARVDAAPEPYTFPWQSLRDWFDRVVAGKTPCDFRKDIAVGRVGTGDCTAPVQMAAKVIWTRIENVKDGFLAHVEADLGFPDGITKEWYGALLDERGRLATDWVQPDGVELNRTWLRFRVKDKGARELKRAALVKERP